MLDKLIYLLQQQIAKVAEGLSKDDRKRLYADLGYWCDEMELELMLDKREQEAEERKQQ